MGKSGRRRFMKFIGGCKLLKVAKRGNRVRITMKCEGKKIDKTLTAQEILEMS